MVLTPSDTINSPFPSSGAAALPTGTSAQFALRSNTLGKYDLPPLSPPPVGPLPQIPIEGDSVRSTRNREGIHRPSTTESDGKSNLRIHVPPVLGPLAARPLTAPGRQLPVPPLSPGRLGPLAVRPLTAPGRQLPVPPLSPGRQGTALSLAQLTPPIISPAPPARSPTPGSEGGPPLFLQRIPSTQRGRESPFPTQPLLTHKSSQSGFLPSASTSTLGSPNASIQNQHSASAGVFVDDAGHQDGSPRLDINWQPRSASALDDRKSESRQSWVSVEEPRTPSSTRNSSASSHRDLDSLLGALQDSNEEQLANIAELYLRQSGFTEDDDVDDDDKSRYPEDEADTENRYSVFNDNGAPSRISILDKERSSRVRQQFLKRVEEMYSKEGIERGLAPPVPKIPPLSPSRR